MSLNQLMELYYLNGSHVYFKHIESNELGHLAERIESYRKEVHTKYNQDEHLIDTLNVLRKYLFKLINSLSPYSTVFSIEEKETLLKNFMKIKNSYPELFSNTVIEIAKIFRGLFENNRNYLYEFMCNNLKTGSKDYKKYAIVVRRAIKSEEKKRILENVDSSSIKFFTENSFRKSLETFNEVIYIGSPNSFGDYVKNTFRGRVTVFIAYDIFTNSLKPKKIFEDIDKNGTFSTLFKNVIFGDPIPQKSNITLDERNSLNIAVNKFIEDQKRESNNHHDAMDACILYLENDRFLFVPIDSKIRVFTPEDNSLIKQINFKEIEEDDYIILRNERDTKLIAEAADRYVLKSNAEEFRKMQDLWKNKLRRMVEEKGAKKVSDILSRKYGMKTASVQSVRSWCSEDTICPHELEKLLRATGYQENESRNIFKIMKLIQRSHVQAGKIISNILTKELSKEITDELEEKGYYTFESKEFDGASFNIERIISIDQTKHRIAPYNLMKPIDIA